MKKEVRRKFHKSAEIEALFSARTIVMAQLKFVYACATTALYERVKAKQHGNRRSSSQD